MRNKWKMKLNEEMMIKRKINNQNKKEKKMKKTKTKRRTRRGRGGKRTRRKEQEQEQEQDKKQKMKTKPTIMEKIRTKHIAISSSADMNHNILNLTFKVKVALSVLGKFVEAHVRRRQ